MHGKEDLDAREIRNVTKENINSRSNLSLFRDPRDGGDYTRCPCTGPFIKPNGNIYICGCIDSPKIGTVFDGFEIPTDEFGDSIECHQQLREVEEGG